MLDKEQPIDTSLGIYNPGNLPPETLLQEFIARRHQLDKALSSIRESQAGHTPQHLLILGPRGIGKTMFLLALAYSIEKDPALNQEWLPVVFPEESYSIGDLADFWLFATETLLHKIDRSSASTEVEQLRELNPPDIEEQAQRLFLKYLSESGKRAFLVIENLDEFFASVADEDEQHRLRAFLMESDRLLFAASAASYFKSSGDIDLPFYDFFRIFRLERFDRDEMLAVLHKLAETRKDKHVLQTLSEQPERIDSLRVLTGGNPRLIKMIYRLLQEGGTGTAQRDLDRLLEDCTPYFKHRIEELKTEERRVFDHVARHWDPVAVGDIQSALRRKSNQVSTYLNRLIDKGFIEEAEGSTPKRKSYQVAERFYNIYYLMRFSRSGRQRLTWLVQAMRILYSESDFRKWTQETLQAWEDTSDTNQRENRAAFFHSLSHAAESRELRSEIINQAVETAWNEDQLQCLNHLVDTQLAHETLGSQFELIDFFAQLPNVEKEKLGYEPRSAAWWYNLTWPLKDKRQFLLAEKAYRTAIKLDPKFAYPWNGLGNLLQDHLQRFDDAEDAYRTAIQLDPKGAYPHAGLSDLLQKQSRNQEAKEAALQGAILGPQINWPRYQFLEVCADDPSPWQSLLPHLLKQLTCANKSELLEFIIRGLTFLLSSKHLSSQEVSQLILEHKAQEPLSEILLALQSLDDPALLTKASPERQAFAKDFLKKITLLK